MDVTLDDIRRHYSRLSDEALLQVPRQDLTPQAQLCYDAEVEGRGLNRKPVPAAKDPDLVQLGATRSAGGLSLVSIAKFAHGEDAHFARELLESDGIASFLSSDAPFALKRRPGDEIDLMVAVADEEQARLVLESQLSDEELAAQAEAAAPPDSDLR